MNWAGQGSDQVYRVRQIALLLSDQDRTAALAYASELELEAAARTRHAPAAVSSCLEMERQ